MLLMFTGLVLGVSGVFLFESNGVWLIGLVLVVAGFWRVVLAGLRKAEQ